MPIEVMGVRIDGGVAHELAITATLHVIAQTGSGLATLAEIRRAPFPVTVVPQEGDPGAGPSELTVEAFQNATQQGKVARGGVGHVLGGFGTGQGTATEIDFTPALHVPGIPENGPDPVLIHELAHATRYARGKLNAVPMYEFGFHTREEVHAGIVTNMLRSERGMTRFRIQRIPERWGSLADAQLTFGMARHLIRVFADVQPEYFAELAAVDTAFNPVREALATA